MQAVGCYHAVDKEMKHWHTTHPRCAMYAISAAMRQYTDLPDALGPALTRVVWDRRSLIEPRYCAHCTVIDVGSRYGPCQTAACCRLLCRLRLALANMTIPEGLSPNSVKPGLGTSRLGMHT